MASERSAPSFPTDRHMSFAVDGVPQRAGAEWYRGDHCNYNPLRDNLATAQMLADNVLDGWLPPEPLIGPETRITAFGSCFARHIYEWLNARQFKVLNADSSSSAHIVTMGEGMVNTFSLLEQVRWALEGEHYEGQFWHGPGTTTFEDSEEARRDTAKILLQTDVFIITLGLSEIWYDKLTGGVFWRGVPARLFDPERHAFRVASFAENKANIRTLHDLLLKHRPDARIIFTVSPIPLVATFRPVSCVTANSASKALLRGAVDEVYREVSGRGAMFYWPSYELIQDVFVYPWLDDRRHPRKPVLNFIMMLFERWWCRGQGAELPLAEAYARAVLASGGLQGRIGKRLNRLLEEHNRDELAAILAEVDETTDTPFTIACARDVLEEWDRTAPAVAEPT